MNAMMKWQRASGRIRRFKPALIQAHRSKGLICFTMPEPYWLLLDGIYADRVEAIQKITNSDITRPIPISEANAMMRKAVFQHMRYRQRK